MNNQQLQQLLKNYPDDMPVRLLSNPGQGGIKSSIDLTDENILHTSETAFVNGQAAEDEWDCEDGKVELGDGQQYLLFNPIIV